MNRFFVEGGPETSNLRWGIESVLLKSGGVHRAQLVRELEAYFCEVVDSSSKLQLLELHQTATLSALDEGALVANVRFEGGSDV